MSSVGRNEKCPCGSNKKYKKCCGGRANDMSSNSSPDPGTMVPQKTGMFRHVGKGRRDYAFTTLPPGIGDRSAFCRKWAEAELCSRGMACQVFHWDGEPGEPGVMFACPIFRVDHTGVTDDEVLEWGTEQFFEEIKNSFEKAVNDELAKQGLPRSYKIYDDFVIGQANTN